MTQKKKIILFAVIAGALLIIGLPALAARVEWPNTPMGSSFPDIETGETGRLIPEMVRYLYEWAIGLGGLLVFISLIIAGMQYLTSVGNPSTMREARSRIVSALLGLALLLSSWLILTTINPRFTHFPELTLNLADLAASIEKMLGHRIASPPCTYAYVYEETNFGGDPLPITVEEGRYDKFIVSGWAFCMKWFPIPPFWFLVPCKQGAKVSDILSIRQMRPMRCPGGNFTSDPEAETEERDESKDDFLPILRRAIAFCENEKLVEMREKNMTGSAECTIGEILELVPEFIILQYNFFSEPLPPNEDAKCETYENLEGTFGIYTFDSALLPHYDISDGNCTLQMHYGSAWLHKVCGDRISEIYATDGDITRYIDKPLECIRLTPYEEHY